MQQKCFKCIKSTLFIIKIITLMYKYRYAIFNGWDFELLSISETDLGGYRVRENINLFRLYTNAMDTHRMQVPV